MMIVVSIFYSPFAITSNLPENIVPTNSNPPFVLFYIIGALPIVFLAYVIVSAPKLKKIPLTAAYIFLILVAVLLVRGCATTGVGLSVLH